MPVYIEKAEIWSGVTDPSETNTQTKEYSATQPVDSLKIKLCHTMDWNGIESQICSYIYFLKIRTVCRSNMRVVGKSEENPNIFHKEPARLAV